MMPRSRTTDRASSRMPQAAWLIARIVPQAASARKARPPVLFQLRSRGQSAAGAVGHPGTRRFMRTLLNGTLLFTLASATVLAPINAGDLKPEPDLPFTMAEVATFKLPWRIAFLPDGRMLVTEKVGPVWLVTQQGKKTPVDNVPAVLWQGQGGMLGVFVSPHYASDHSVYLTYSEPGEGGSSLALARARLGHGENTASLDGLQVLWRQMPKGRGGQVGAQIAFSP